MSQKSFMRNILVTVLIICSVISCKKEKKEPVKFQGNNAATNTDSINGEFRITRVYVANNTTPAFSHRIISASFYPQKSKVNDTLFVTPVSVGNVQLNNVQLQESGPPVLYVDTTGVNFNTPYNWIIQGSGSIAGFSIADIPVFPSYSNITLPDTIFTGQQQVFNLGNYQATSASIQIDSNTSGFIFKTVYSPTSSIVFTSNDLNSLVNTPMTTVYLAFSKEVYKLMNGKVYRFKTVDVLMKDCFVKP